MADAHDQHRLIIVGAGPAGMAAALEAAECGISVLLVDEQHRIGGQIFRRPPEEFASDGRLADGYPWAGDLLAQAERHESISFLGGTTVFGVFLDGADAEGRTIEVVLSGSGGAQRRRCERLLIATGAFDLPVALPGWTLPGVFTAGAVQSFVKAQKLLPGTRFVVAGSHPLQIIVAAQLHASGATVSEVAIARSWFTPRELAFSLRAIPGHLRLLLSLMAAVAQLVVARVPIRWSTLVVSADPGESGALAGVTLARCDRQWRPTEQHRHLDADALVLGFGFSASTELARQIGCQLLYNSAAGGWLVAHDGDFRTSVPGVYVAGEPTGVAGAAQSRAEGMRAAQAIAVSLGVTLSSARERRANRALRTARRFSHVVQTLFAPRRRALAKLATRGTMICRCERVDLGRLQQTIDDNPYMRSIGAVKLETRCGMGPCQGRYCESSLAQILADRREKDVADVGVFASHVPVKPVPLSSYEALAMTSELPAE